MAIIVLEASGTFQKTMALIEIYIFQVIISMENLISFFTSEKYKVLLRYWCLRRSTNGFRVR
jgi:hypothetical protein